MNEALKLNIKNIFTMKILYYLNTKMLTFPGPYECHMNHQTEYSNFVIFLNYIYHYYLLHLLCIVF